MPGRAEHVEGEVRVLRDGYARCDVEGLQAILNKFIGTKVSIIIEELDEDE